MHDWRVIEYKWMSMDEIRALGRDAIHFGLQLLFDNDSDTIRPLLVPKPKEGDKKEAPVEETPQETPVEEVPQEAPVEDTQQTQDIFGDPDEEVPQKTDEEEGI